MVGLFVLDATLFQHIDDFLPDDIADIAGGGTKVTKFVGMNIAMDLVTIEQEKFMFGAKHELQLMLVCPLFHRPLQSITRIDTGS